MLIVHCLMKSIDSNRTNKKSLSVMIISHQTKAFEYGGPTATRTRDQLIKSQLLYQLSYRSLSKDETKHCFVKA